MSLRAFHLVFIAISAAFAVVFSAWLAGGFLREGGLLGLAGSALSLAAAVGMAVYGVRFFRRTRGLTHPG
jgi:hypothetical protein